MPRSNQYDAADYRLNRVHDFGEPVCSGATGAAVDRMFCPFGEEWKPTGAKAMVTALATGTSNVGWDLVAHTSIGDTDGTTIASFDGGTINVDTTLTILDPEDDFPDVDMEADGYVELKNRDSDATLKARVSLLYQLKYAPAYNSGS